MPSSRYYRFKTRTSEEKSKRKEMIFFWSFFTGAFIFIMWSFFFSPFFKITEIKLPENALVTNSDIYKIINNGAFLNFEENFFILSKSKIKSSLTATFPDLTDINIKKELFHSLIIDFEKRVQIGIWCNNNDCYYFDKEGIIFKEASQTEGFLILKIQDFNQNEVFLGDKILTDAQLKFIMEFNRKVAENNQIKITEFKIGPSANSYLEAITNHGWSIYLNQNQDPALEANNLFTILNEAIKTDDSKLEYIDLRIPTRIFYKMR